MTIKIEFDGMGFCDHCNRLRMLYKRTDPQKQLRGKGPASLARLCTSCVTKGDTPEV